MARSKLHHNGVKFSSILNELKFFHVSESGLPPCIAHDLFEGIVENDIQLALKEFEKKKIMSLSLCNKKLNTLTFLHEEKSNYPSLEKIKGSLPGSASQNMWLLRVLPFVFVDYEHLLIDNSIWQMILCLRSICNIVLSFNLSIGQVALLKSLIDEYIILRHQNFPNESLKAKHHFLQHYPLLITMFGCLRYVWTLRFENKHQYFKRSIRHSLNFKNVLLSLSKQHQLLAAITSSYKYQNINKIKAENYEIINLTHHSTEMSLLKQEKINCHEFKYISYDITFRGINYKTGKAICFNVDEYSFYDILFIKSLIIDKNFEKLLFIGSTCKIAYIETTGLYEEYFSSDSLSCVNYSSILSPETILQWEHKGTKLFYFKSAPFESL